MEDDCAAVVVAAEPLASEPVENEGTLPGGPRRVTDTDSEPRMRALPSCHTRHT